MLYSKSDLTRVICLLMLFAYLVTGQGGPILKQEKVEDAAAVFSVRLECERGWIPGPDRSCFRFVVGNRTWWSANSGCRDEDYGGQLAVLDTYERNAFIIGHIHLISRNLGDQVCWWIGASKNGGAFQWLDKLGKKYAMTYTDWLPLQPRDEDVNVKICKIADGRTSQTYGWKSDSVRGLAAFICERKENSSLDEESETE